MSIYKNKDENNLNNKMIIGWLNSQNGIGNSGIMKLLEYFQTPENIWDNLHNEINNIKFIRKEILYELLESKSSFEEKFTDLLNDNNVRVITILDDDYPQKLYNINNPPCILYCKGNIDCLRTNSIAVVGSRKATDYGKWCAERLSKELAKRGITIISGLAYGVDSIAHRTALKHNSKTIGVIGSGINIVYPQKNEGLYNEIVEKGSLIITEYPFDCAPVAANFPNRNRIISGLSSGVLIIEAQDKSGTLITASHALEQGKEVFCVPGNINSIYSIGTNKLIRDGAKLVMDIYDILDEIPEFNIFKSSMPMQLSFSEIDSTDLIKKDIIDTLKSGLMDINELCARMKYPTKEIISNITILEMSGIVIKLSSGMLTLAN